MRHTFSDQRQDTATDIVRITSLRIGHAVALRGNVMPYEQCCGFSAPQTKVLPFWNLNVNVENNEELQQYILFLINQLVTQYCGSDGLHLLRLFQSITY
jgi:hypothetical protein